MLVKFAKLEAGVRIANRSFVDVPSLIGSYGSTRCRHVACTANGFVYVSQKLSMGERSLQ